MPIVNGNHYPRASSNGPGKMHPLQTNVDYNYGMAPYSAYPFSAPPLNPQAIPIVTTQVEYYLSVENLCKDMFIRKRMDSQGFVPFDLIAGFNRMVELSGEDVNIIRFACEQSDKLDYVIAEDGSELLRLHDGWQNFVLPLAERDPPARSNGPKNMWFRSSHSRMYMPPVMPSYPNHSPTMYPQGFPPREMDHMYSPYTNGAEFQHGMNGGEVNGSAYPGETRLSAAVPEFSPSGLNGFSVQNASTYSDEQVSQLYMVFANGQAQDMSYPASDSHNGVTNGSEHEHVNGQVNGADESARYVPLIPLEKPYSSN